MQTIFYTNSPCGAGKSHTASQLIKENQYSDKHLFTVPTKQLSGQIAAGLLDAGVQNVFEINSDLVKNDYIKNAVQKAINDVNDLTNGVVITTSAAFLNLPNYIRKATDGWVHIYDEPPKLVETHEINLPYEHQFLTKLIEVTPSPFFENMSDVRAIDKNLIEKYIERYSDQFTNYIKPILKAVISDYYMVFVDSEQWTKIVINNEITQDNFYNPNTAKFGNNKNKITFVTVIKPNVEKYFSRSIYMGANFDQTMMFQFWKEFFKTKFIVAKDIESNLRFTEHQNGALLNIIYGQKDKYSRYQANLTDEKSDLNGAQLHYQFAQDFLDKDAKTLTLCNLDDIHYAPFNWEKVSSIPHGLNKYQDDYHQFSFNAAYNFSSRTYKLLENLKISKEAINYDMNVAPLYQGLLRTSLRNPDSTVPVKCYVPSKILAEEIGKMFIGCTLTSINGEVTKIVGKTATSPAVRRLLRLKKGLMEDIQQLEQRALELNPNEALDIFLEGDKPICYNFYQDLYSEGTSNISNIADFGKMLTKMSKYNIYANKDENFLFNTSIFLDNSRKKSSVLGTSSIIFDFDKGDLTPAMFDKIFRDELKLTYISHNSSSHGIDGANRFHTIFPVNMFMTTPVYCEVVVFMLKELEKRGYYTFKGTDAEVQKQLKIVRKKHPEAKLSGIDTSKLNLSSLFYAPGKMIGADPKNQFLTKSFMKDSEIEKHIFDVSKFIEKVMSALEKTIANEPNITEVIKKPLGFSDIGIYILKENSSDFFNRHMKKNNNGHKQKIINKIEKEMGPKNRSNLACAIGGSIKHWHNVEDKLDIINLMIEKGASVSAINSAKKYANISNHNLN